MSDPKQNRTPARHWLIIPAAGVGSRMGAEIPKQYLELLGQTILERTLRLFLDDHRFAGIFLGVSKNDPYWKKLADKMDRLPIVFYGGDERSDTVLRGLQALADHVAPNQKDLSRDWVWVHDAARPCLSQQEIDALVGACHQSDGSEDASAFVLAAPVVDTVKLSNEHMGIEKTLDRERIWRAMTPQISRFGLLKGALERCGHEALAVTDEASALEQVGISPRLIEGQSENLKITRPADLDTATHIINSRSAVLMTPRIGSGFDVHAFEEGDFLTLCGVRVPHSKQFKAHSDGDVALHALMDAILGALAKGDIGHHFPDTDDQWKGADSRALLAHVMSIMESMHYRVGNVDLTLMAQKPKLAPYITQMVENLAEDLHVDTNCVNVKATTTEKLGFTGREEGIAAQATILLLPSAAPQLGSR